MTDVALIEGPAAWRGSELATDPSWRRTLTDGESAALERAALAAEARDVGATGFGPAEFAVPELKPLFVWLAGQLEHGPGVARVSGVPVERLPRDTLRRLFWGFCVNLGTPMYQTAAGEILGEVKDETGTGAALTYDGPGPLKSARTVARSTGALRFHRQDRHHCPSLRQQRHRRRTVEGGLERHAAQRDRP